MKFEIQINKQGDNVIPNLIQGQYVNRLRLESRVTVNETVPSLIVRANLRTDKAKRVRIASRLSRQEQCSVGDTLRAWSKFKTGQNFLKNIVNLEIRERVFNAGFTLAEVLITLGIIGIVAAMTIPTLIQKNFEKQTVAKLRETQSILSQAIRMAEEEYGSMEGWGITGYDEESAIIIANNLKTTLKLALDCGVEDTEAHCAPNKMYQFLKGGNNNNFATDRTMYKIVLTNGTAIYIRGNNDTTSANAVFYTDTNGKSSPNTWGKDLFQFSARPDGLYPTGHPSKSSEATATSCHKEGSGFGCAYYVLNNENMNYLH